MTRLRTVAALALACSLVVAGCAFGGGGRTYDVTIYFPRAISLYPKSTVKVLGLPAGTVQSVEVVGTQVKVLVHIKNDIPLPANVKAAIVPRSLIGERFVELTPAWHEGQPKAKDGHVIELEDTIVPVEPDEALAALKKFLDSLDPHSLGRLVHNLSDDLKGNGETLGSALEQLSDVVQTLDEKRDTLLSIVDNFDAFTKTLTTREQQLGRVLDSFGEVTQILADERQDLRRLLDGLAGVSQDGFDLVAEHAARLETDISTLTRLGRSVDANLGGVEALLDSNPAIINGFIDAYNPDARAINIRQNFGPLVAQALDPLFEDLGVDIPSICVPVLTGCAASVPVSAKSATRPVSADLTPPRSPVTDLLDLLGSGTTTAPSSDEPGFVRNAFSTLLGTGS